MQYYVVEGIDTSGKTTQCNLIKENYPCISLLEYRDSNKNDIVLISEPGGTELGNNVREILLNKKISIAENSAFLLFLAQRAELFARIKDLPNLIIADRSLISGIAYAHNIDMYEALKLNLFATSGILPKKIVFLELSKETLKKRIGKKTLDNIESSGIEYLIKTQNRFKDILRYLQTQEALNIVKQYKDGNDFKDSIKSQKYNPQKPELELPEVLILNAELSKENLHSQICSFFGI